MTVLIIEDETLAAEKLESLLLEIYGSIKVVSKIKSIEAAKEWFELNDIPD